MELKRMIEILNQMIEEGADPSSIMEIKYDDGTFKNWSLVNSIYKNVDGRIIITNN